MDWATFWANPPPYFSNPAMRKAHLRLICGGLIDKARVAPGSSLLDYGCGDPDLAPLLLEAGITVFLYDSSPFCQAIARKFAEGTPGVRAVDENFLDDTSLAPLDAILVCSVVQYLDDEALAGLLRRAHGRLGADGRLFLVDVPDHSSLIRDTLELLTDALRHGYFCHALVSLFTRLFTSYGVNLRDTGLRRYSSAEMMALLRAHGFSPVLASRNFAIKKSRHTYIATRAADA